MKRLNKTLRRKLQRKQRSRSIRRYRRRQTRRRQRGGDLPVPPGALVSVRFGGEYGSTLLVPSDVYNAEQQRGGLED